MEYDVVEEEEDIAIRSPLKLSALTTKEIIFNLLQPYFDQISVLCISFVSQSDHGNLQKNQLKKLAHNAAYCCKLSLDLQVFCSATFSVQDSFSHYISPHIRSHSLVLCVCGLKGVNKSIYNPIARVKDYTTGDNVTFPAIHVYDGIFVVPLGSVAFSSDLERNVQFSIEFADVVLEMETGITRQKTDEKKHHRNYSEEYLPLHYKTLMGDVREVLNQVERGEEKLACVRDDMGVQAAALALWRGNRVLFALLFWHCHGWNISLVFHLLRIRLELNGGFIDGESFCDQRDRILQAIFVHKPGKSRTLSFDMADYNKSINYLTENEEDVLGQDFSGQASYARNGSLCFLIQSELQFGPAEKKEKRVMKRRRSSLDFLIQAINQARDENSE